MAGELISREAARAQGLKKFFTGVPCRHGHLASRIVADGKCTVCLAGRAKVRSKLWARANPEKVRAKTAKWRAANPEKWRESNRASKQRNQKKYTDAQRADYALNPEKYRTVERKRRAQMAGSGGTHTAPDLKEILEAQGHRCAYCRADLRQARKHVDHVIPLARGGSNGRANLQYLCAPCNHAKNAKDPIAYAQSIGLLL